MKSSYKIFRFSSLIFRNVIVPFEPLGANIFIMLDFLINMHCYVFSLAIKLMNQWPNLPKINQPFPLWSNLHLTNKINLTLIISWADFVSLNLHLCNFAHFLFSWPSLNTVQVLSGWCRSNWKVVYLDLELTQKDWVVMELIVNNDGYLWGRGGNFVTMLKGLRLTFEHWRDSFY